ncbi:paraquat-inducible membrane protein A [Zhengella mangrovi]|uniref:Paraquat-inducible membrane protein A n=1 Tax=Zhengella mangrovi TaxID=1982044 RepID=A0A2G1QP22_9HYPH|nr:paraquat-inducible protein A [Zhengella mangrovi]PHP67297.1 paraquat-inducible membrane protein A [Zhengella mangrovi]
MRTALALCLFAATASFVLGVTLPLVEIERLIVFSDEPSLVQMVTGLWQRGDMALAALIALFSIVTPASKLLLLQIAAAKGPGSRAPSWLHGLSRWSMLDVLLVAIVVFAAKTSGLATAITKPGLWCFAASVILTATAAKLADR